MKAIVRHFRNWHIRKTREKAAYWKAKADIWRLFCAEAHMGYERDYLVEAIAEQKRYETRLESLQAEQRIRQITSASADKQKAPGD